ncbi:MAG TPA: hypothetical protein VGF28_10665 [Thermoanaerobaculia bacterium]|jgi:hypothetical protein
MKNSIKLSLSALLLCALTLPAFGARKATVKIINASNWDIHHIYLSSSDDRSWGEDQLEDEILSKGDSLTLTNISCDLYDIQVVDEDGDECVIEEVDLCGDESYWKITDKELLECEGYR